MGTCILVLGLHRGGTSCTAGVLHRLGVDMNPTSGTLPGNTQEDVELQLLHEEAIGHWTTPVPDFERVQERYTAALQERQSKELWGYKDPRLNFLLPEVLKILGDDVKIVAVYRNAQATARGVVRVNPGISLEEAMRITAAYAEARNKVVRLVAREKLCLVMYDNLVDLPQKTVRILARFVGLSVNEDAVNFVDPGLRHFK